MILLTCYNCGNINTDYILGNNMCNNCFHVTCVVEITPLNDLKNHYLKNCECNPTISTTFDSVIITHNSFDGREGLEMAKQILKQ